MVYFHALPITKISCTICCVLPRKLFGQQDMMIANTPDDFYENLNLVLYSDEAAINSIFLEVYACQKVAQGASRYSPKYLSTDVWG